METEINVEKELLSDIMLYEIAVKLNNLENNRNSEDLYKIIFCLTYINKYNVIDSEKMDKFLSSSTIYNSFKNKNKLFQELQKKVPQKAGGVLALFRFLVLSALLATGLSSLIIRSVVPKPTWTEYVFGKFNNLYEIINYGESMMYFNRHDALNNDKGTCVLLSNLIVNPKSNITETLSQFEGVMIAKSKIKIENRDPSEASLGVPGETIKQLPPLPNFESHSLFKDNIGTMMNQVKPFNSEKNTEKILNDYNDFMIQNANEHIINAVKHPDYITGNHVLYSVGIPSHRETGIARETPSGVKYCIIETNMLYEAVLTHDNGSSRINNYTSSVFTCEPGYFTQDELKELPQNYVKISDNPIGSIFKTPGYKFEKDIHEGIKVEVPTPISTSVQKNLPIYNLKQADFIQIKSTIDSMFQVNLEAEKIVIEENRKIKIIAARSEFDRVQVDIKNQPKLQQFSWLTQLESPFYIDKWYPKTQQDLDNGPPGWKNTNNPGANTMSLAEFNYRISVMSVDPITLAEYFGNYPFLDPDNPYCDIDWYNSNPSEKEFELGPPGWRNRNKQVSMSQVAKDNTKKSTNTPSQVAKDSIPKTSENRFSSFMTTNEDDAAEAAEAETKQQQKEKQTKYKRRKNKDRKYTERQRQREGWIAHANAVDNYFPTREKLNAEYPAYNWLVGNTTRLNREKAGLVNLVEDPEEFVGYSVPGGSNRSIKRKKNKNKTRKNKSKGKRRNKSKGKRRNKSRTRN